MGELGELDLFLCRRRDKGRIGSGFLGQPPWVNQPGLHTSAMGAPTTPIYPPGRALERMNIQGALH